MDLLAFGRDDAERALIQIGVVGLMKLAELLAKLLPLNDAAVAAGIAYPIKQKTIYNDEGCIRCTIEALSRPQKGNLNER
jgi:hypothetical protein